ncbi:MAG: gliding motility-associated C-terminal domain-containing protein [Saprospiraceae bacterium]|nr:gliding motility-associated C-terminal domain-containing protein [Saprospiraceae bacterium]
MTNRLIGVFLISLLCLNLVAQPTVEDCNNGVDDDGNGLADLNDPNCKCNGIKDTLFVPSSLIPNPSFEEFNCCPTGLAQLNCSKGWIQASAATSDYFHTCGFRQDPMRGSPPLPLPAGNGYVGFLDLYNHPARNATYKEYVGACLNSPMIAGREYTLSFWIGFGQRGNAYGPRAITTLGIFGTGQCSSLPFGNNNSWLCPSNYANWSQVASVTASGTNKWVKVNLKITPTSNIAAMAIGPQCQRADGYYYFFIDELILEETVKFDSLLLSISGDPCKDSVSLNSPASRVTRIKYQWYKDGVAIASATLPNFIIPRGQEGSYVLKAIDGSDCELSNSYQYHLDTSYYALDTNICSGDSLSLAGQTFKNTGDYQLLLQNSIGCDSIIDLKLQVNTPDDRFLSSMLCEGQSIQYNGITYDKTGIYNWYEKDMNGCDSLTQLNLTVAKIKNTVWDTFICEGRVLIAGIDTFSSTGIYTQHHISAEGCDSIHSIQLKVAQNASTQMDTFICEGQSLQLLGYTFDTAGNYQIQLNTVKGCDSILNLRLSFHPKFNLRLDTSQCAGDTLKLANLNIFQSGIYQIPLLSQNGCDSLITLNYYSKPKAVKNIDTLICYDQTIVLGAIHYPDSGRFQQFHISAIDCDSIVNIQISKTQKPVLNSTVKNILCHRENNGSITTGLTGSTQPYSYLWEDGSSQSLRQQLAKGSYQLTVTDRFGCRIFDTFTIAEPDPINYEIQTKNANCKSISTGKIFLNRIEGGVGPYVFKINGSEYSFQNGVEDIATGTHTLEITDANGCKEFETFTILDPVLGAVDLAPDSIHIILGDSVFLMAQVLALDSIVSVEWSGPGIIRCTNCLSSYVIPGAKGGLFTVKIIDGFGCEYIASVFISVEQKYFVPNAFSPNGDQINDFFNLFSDRSVEMIDVLKIFDRWGNLQFEGKNISPHRLNDGWNGEFKGQKSLPGVYVYLFQFHDKAGIFHQLSGDVTLIR